MVWGGLRITIINDIFGFNTPLAYIRFYRMSMDWRDWTFNVRFMLFGDMAPYSSHLIERTFVWACMRDSMEQSELNLRLTLDADAYNIRIAMWEPIIEPWKCLIKVKPVNICYALLNFISLLT